ncbi:rRNA pseudouridine synthase [Candidatus Saccharibacteria bacterium]|nr:rRNA pseudouridine synthase [Candidatus Saccharibacteria bacterium]
MRINKFLAQATGLSRRKADDAIAAGRVTVNGKTAEQGMDVTGAEQIQLDDGAITPDVKTQTIMLNKPVGYVVSRDGQGSKTVYDLLPQELHHLKPVGRLDKDSSGLLLMTNDGDLAHELSHPSRQKVKVYEVTLDKPLQPLHRQMISDHGVQLDDGPSKFELEKLADDTTWRVTMREGRNRQIRRTFAALDYTVTKLHRTHFGPYALNENLDSYKEEV